MTSDQDIPTVRRKLRLRIGRLRRRIDRRLRAARHAGGRLISWRRYVERYPGRAVLAALGVGLAASGLDASAWPRRLGLPLLQGLLDKTFRQIWKGLCRVWNEAAAGRSESAAAVSDSPAGEADGRA